jgi:hypothetical protein
LNCYAATPRISEDNTMNEKVTVTIAVEAKMRTSGECEMTREEYEQWCDRVDNARGGWEHEKVAEELMMLAKFDIADGDLVGIEVEEIFAAEDSKTHAA